MVGSSAMMPHFTLSLALHGFGLAEHSSMEFDRPLLVAEVLAS